MDFQNKFEFCKREEYYPKDVDEVVWLDYRNLKIKSMSVYPIRSEPGSWISKAVKLYLTLETEKGAEITCLTTFDRKNAEGAWCCSRDDEINFKRLMTALNSANEICLEARDSGFSENLLIGKIYYID